VVVHSEAVKRFEARVCVKIDFLAIVEICCFGAGAGYCMKSPISIVSSVVSILAGVSCFDDQSERAAVDSYTSVARVLLQVGSSLPSYVSYPVMVYLAFIRAARGSVASREECSGSIETKRRWTMISFSL
jgi:hypothetical protein